MSHSDKPLAEQAFCFGDGRHQLRVRCRRLPDEVARVTQTLQLDVEELFASLLDWDAPKPKPVADAEAQGGGAAGDGQRQVVQQGQPEQQQQAEQQAPDSKQLCGNVAHDQPDLIGLDVWPAAVALCEYCAAAPQLVVGAAVCELGAGMGLPGLLCVQLGAASVLLTDYEPVVVEAMRANAALNGLQARCDFLALDWFDLAPLAPAQRHAYDLVLLADVIYAAAVVRPLVQTLLSLLRPGTGVALVAHRIRRPLIFDREERIAKLQERDEIFEEFQAACRAAGLHVRFLNGGCAAAQAGDDPLLLAIGAAAAQLQRFPAPPGSSSDGEAAEQAGATAEAMAAEAEAAQ